MADSTQDRGRADSFYIGDDGRSDLAIVMERRGLRPKVDKSKVIRDLLREEVTRSAGAKKGGK